MPRFSPPAHEVLGTLAALRHSGPHTTAPLRRQTRLTPDAFESALHELDAFGLVQLHGAGTLWLTRQGERWLQRLYA